MVEVLFIFAFCMAITVKSIIDLRKNQERSKHIDEDFKNMILAINSDLMGMRETSWFIRKRITVMPNIPGEL